MSPENGPSSAQDHGKCASCGFLSRANRSHPVTAYDEINWYGRRGLEPLAALTVGEARKGLSHPYVECFLQEMDLFTEIEQEVREYRDGGWDAAVQRRFWKNQDCPKWFAYSPGLSPQDHQRKYDLQRLEQDRRDFELKLFALEQKAQEDSKLILAESRQLAADSKQTVVDIKKIAEQMTVSAAASDRFARRVTFLIILLAVVQILVGALALAPESWRAKLFGQPVPVVRPEQIEPEQH